jgi:hypothetical protein
LLAPEDSQQICDAKKKNLNLGLPVFDFYLIWSRSTLFALAFTQGFFTKNFARWKGYLRFSLQATF